MSKIKPEKLEGQRVTLSCECEGEEWEKTGTFYLGCFIYYSKENINEIFTRGVPKIKKSGDKYLLESPGPAYGIKHYSPDGKEKEFKLRASALENALK